MNGINLKYSDFLNARRDSVLFEDFHSGAPDEWTAVATTGTVAAADERGGVLSITTNAADNAEGTLTLDSKPALVAANKSISFAARVQFAEANTDAGNLFIGLTDEAVATAMGDDAAGPPADYSGAGFHKLDGGTVMIAEVSNGTTQETQVLDANGSINKIAQASGSASYRLFEVDLIPKTSTTMDVVFKIDGIVVHKVNDFVWTSMAAMAPVVVVKAGSASAEVIKVDFIGLAMNR